MRTDWKERVADYFPSGLATAPWRSDFQWEYVATFGVLHALVDPAPRAIIKTDAHNEFADKPCRGGVAGLIMSCPLLETDPRVAGGARAKGHDVYDGSIISFPGNFVSGAFEMIVDCSTLDHLDPLIAPKALREYHRLLAPGGCLLLFVWESEDRVDIDRAYADGAQPYGPNHQFYFKRHDPERWATDIGFHAVSWSAFFTGAHSPVVSATRYMVRYIFERR